MSRRNFSRITLRRSRKRIKVPAENEKGGPANSAGLFLYSGPKLSLTEDTRNFVIFVTRIQDYLYEIRI